MLCYVCMYTIGMSRLVLCKNKQDAKLEKKYVHAHIAVSSAVIFGPGRNQVNADC